MFNSLQSPVEIDWPEGEDAVPDVAFDLIMKLLQQDPVFRLGTGGSHEVKEHVFFEEVDWKSLLRQKADFVPQLEGEDDTSYFDSKCKCMWGSTRIGLWSSNVWLRQRVGLWSSNVWLRQRVEFVSQLEGGEDTSYFDSMYKKRIVFL